MRTVGRRNLNMLRIKEALHSVHCSGRNTRDLWYADRTHTILPNIHRPTPGEFVLLPPHPSRPDPGKETNENHAITLNTGQLDLAFLYLQ